VGAIPGAYAFLYYSALDCDALKHEELRTHPADIKRLQAVIEYTATNLYRLKVQGDASFLRMQLEDLKDRLVEAVSNNIACLADAQQPPATPVFELFNPVESDKDALDALDFTTEDIHWKTNATNMTDALVAFAFSLHNAGNAPLLVKFVVASGHAPKSEVDAQSYKNWSVDSFKNYSLILQSGEQQRVEGHLHWSHDASTIPALRFPQPPFRDLDYLKCTFVK